MPKEINKPPQFAARIATTEEARQEARLLAALTGQTLGDAIAQAIHAELERVQQERAKKS